MTEILLPVGQSGGPGEGNHPVRAGDQVYTLDAEQFGVWAYAHGLPGQSEPWNHAAMVSALTAAGAIDAAATIEELRRDGLLVSVSPSNAREFAAAHNLSPLLMGLGEVTEPIDGYALGLLDNPVTTVAGPLFAFWAWSAVEHDLWSACVNLAHDAAEAGGDEDALTDPSQVLQGLLGGLHGLLSANAAYLDRVPA